MKIVAKPIKTMVVFEYEGKVPIPYKFKLQLDDGSEQTIYIDKRITSYRQKIAGIDTIIFECQSVIDGIEKRYKLKYILSDCRWQLYAI
ncbi:MAG: hypothetical protein ACI4LO_08060 [Anaerovoracaceae bacterium]